MIEKNVKGKDFHLTKLDQECANKQYKNFLKGVFYLVENSPVHKSLIELQKIDEIDFS